MFMPWTKGKFLKRSINPLKNGILYLKGGDLKEELSTVKHPYIVHPLNTFFKEEFFDTKAVVYVKVNT
jgi:16S rRNA (guanine527-N7)-methyltransferase